jgi:hypothetical protein
MTSPNLMKIGLALLASAALFAALAPTATADPCVGTTCVSPKSDGACITQGGPGSPSESWTCAGAQGVCRFFWSYGTYNGADCVVFISGGTVCVLGRDDGQGHQNNLVCI